MFQGNPTVRALLAAILLSLVVYPAVAEEPPLEVALEIVHRAGEGPAARVALRNVSRGKLGVIESFGFETVLLHFVIERIGIDGRVPYPPASQYELFDQPKATCLPPGREIWNEILLTAWWHRLGDRGGKALDFNGEGPYGFVLPPGRYRIQAVYSAPPVEAPRRCSTPPMKVVSEWVDFQVRKP
jgi:hypothetical protein